MTNSREKSLLEFPCKFPVKAMGRVEDKFEDVVSAIVLAHASLWPGEEITSRPSKEGNYSAVTAVIEATSQQQLDAIYQELTDNTQVLMAL